MSIGLSMGLTGCYTVIDHRSDARPAFLMEVADTTSEMSRYYQKSPTALAVRLKGSGADCGKVATDTLCVYAYCRLDGVQTISWRITNQGFTVSDRRQTPDKVSRDRACGDDKKLLAVQRAQVNRGLERVN